MLFVFFFLNGTSYEKKVKGNVKRKGFSHNAKKCIDLLLAISILTLRKRNNNVTRFSALIASKVD